MMDFMRSWWGLFLTMAATVMVPFFSEEDESQVVTTLRIWLAWFLSGIQALVLVIILLPVAVLYVFGIYISAGFGLWRLIQHDFGNAEGSTNLKPALQVLYSLAVAQGVLYGYKTIHAYGAKVGLAEFVAKQILYMDKDLSSAYLKDIVEGCEKDPSFATGKNLVTYAVDLMMDPKSNDSFINGVKILGAEGQGVSRRVLTKHLLTRPSSSCVHVIKRLLETLGSRSPYSGKIRAQAARIVALVVSGIHLEEHPGWIHNILFLFETFEQYSYQPERYDYLRGSLPEEYERGWLLEECDSSFQSFHWERERGKFKVKSTTPDEADNISTYEDYKTLVLEGFIILKRLALHPENQRVIINTEGLLLKIMAPLNSKKLHRDQHDIWTEIAEESLELVLQLAASPGETGTKPLGEINPSSEEIITTAGVESILECLECDTFTKISTVQVVLQVSVDASSKKASASSSRIFIWILLLIFLLPDEEVYSDSHSNSIKISRDTSRIAGEKKICSNQELPLYQSVGYVFEDLAEALVTAGGISTRVHAARIVELLVRRYKEDEYLNALMNAMIPVLPEVLNEILGGGSTGEPVANAANNVQAASLQVVDDHLGMGAVSGGGEGLEQTSTAQHQTGDGIGDIKRLHKELTQLCWIIWSRWSNYNIDVDRQLYGIAQKVCWEKGMPGNKSFGVLLYEETKKYE